MRPTFVSRASAVMVVALATACSSMNTGTKADANEQACLETIEAFARAAERCGREYKRSHDAYLARDASGDCKNVVSIRDEAALRQTCLPFVQSQSCPEFLAGTIDPTCSTQLLRSANLRPSLSTTGDSRTAQR